MYVLDASAWIRLFVPDGPMPEGLAESTREVQRGLSSFAAPELILADAAHALTRKQQKGMISASERDALWRDLRRTAIDLLPVSAHVDEALKLAGTWKISAYDALYLAVALHLGAPLFTADEALARVATKAGVAALEP